MATSNVTFESPSLYLVLWVSARRDPFVGASNLVGAGVHLYHRARLDVQLLANHRAAVLSLHDLHLFEEALTLALVDNKTASLTAPWIALEVAVAGERACLAGQLVLAEEIKVEFRDPRASSERLLQSLEDLRALRNRFEAE